MRALLSITAALLAALLVATALPAAAEPTDTQGPLDDTVTAAQGAVDDVLDGVGDKTGDLGLGAPPRESGFERARDAVGGFLGVVGHGLAVAATATGSALGTAGTWASTGVAGGLAALTAPIPHGLQAIGDAARAALLAAGSALAGAAAFLATQVAALASLYASLVGGMRPRSLPGPAWTAIVATGSAASAGAAAYGLAAVARKFGWVLGLPFMGGFSRIEDAELLKHPVRAQLFQVIQSNPGIHASALGRTLDAGWGTIVHHLDKMEKAKLVAVRKVNNQKCYFEAGGKVSRQDMQVASAVRGDSANQIAAYVTSHPMTSQKSMAGELGISPALASFHVKKLVALGVLDKVRRGKETLLTTTDSLRRVPTPEPARVPVLAVAPAIKA